MKIRKYIIICDILLVFAIIILLYLYKQREEISIVDSERVEIVEVAPKVAITFDDGPHPVYTKRLLEGLKSRGVHCSFFVTGMHAKEQPDLIQRMVEEGHLVGNHTYSHIELTANNSEEFIEELNTTSETVYDITEQWMEYVRPPYGCWNQEIEEKVNMIPVFWTQDPLDWNTPNAEIVANRVLSRVKENDIILLHDYYDTSIEAAFLIIDSLIEQGYDIVTVEEILLD